MNKRDLKEQILESKRINHKIMRKIRQQKQGFTEDETENNPKIKNQMIKKYYKDQRIKRHVEKGEWQFLPDIIKIDGKTIINPRKGEL